MGKSKDLATGETRFVNTAGDTMTGALTVGGAVTVNPDADSSLLIKDGGTNALFMTSATGDELYIGANNEYAIRIKSDGTKDVTFDNGSRVTMPSQPFIECTGDNNNTNSFSNNAVFDHWTNRTTPVGITRSGGRFTVPVAGNYLFTYTIYTYVSAAGHYRIHLKKNGNVHMLNQLEISTGARIDSTYDHTVSASIILKMSANDYVEVVAADAMQIYEGIQHNALSMMLLG